MIKKNTKFMFKGGKEKINLVGGIPLSKGEIICFHRKNSKSSYVVEDKKIDCFNEGKNQLVNITYVLRKK